MIRFGPKYTKLKTNLKLARSRLIMLQEKHRELSEKVKRQTADCIIEENYSKAKIKVQTVLRYYASVEAMGIIDTFCEQFLDRFSIFQDKKHLDMSLAQIITSLVWVTPHFQSEIPELKRILKQVSHKYGYKFIQSALQNKQKTVSLDLIERVKYLNPSENEIQQCLQEIASKFNVPKENVTAMNLNFLWAHHKMYGPFKLPSKKLNLSRSDTAIKKNQEHIEVNEGSNKSSSNVTIQVNQNEYEEKVNQNELNNDLMNNDSDGISSKSNQDCQERTLSYDNVKIKKSNVYSAEKSFEFLYPRKEDSIAKTDDCECNCNFIQNGNDQNQDVIDIHKKLDNEMNKKGEIIPIEEPPPSYDDVVRVYVPESSKQNTELDENCNINCVASSPNIPTCPLDLPDDLPEVYT